MAKKIGTAHKPEKSEEEESAQVAHVASSKKRKPKIASSLVGSLILLCSLILLRLIL